MKARSSAALLAILPGLLAAGCAHAPEPTDRPVDFVPDHGWTAKTAATQTGAAMAAETWLASFDDPNLLELVDEALTHNYDLQSFAQNVETARQTAIIAGADRLPQVNAGLDASRRKTNIESGGNLTSITADQHGLGLNVSWEIDLWGRIRDGQSGAIADLQAAQADLAGFRLSLAAQVAKSWYRVSTARLQLDLAENTVRSFESTANLVRDRFQIGISTSLEYRLALANAAAARALRNQREQELDASIRLLEVLLGRYPSFKLQAVDELPAISESVPAGLPSDLLLRRPDIVAAERRLAAADARASQADKALLPSLRLTGSAGTASNELSDLLDADFDVWSIAAGLTQPIFQGGRLRANADRNESIADQAHFTYLNTLLSAFREVETNLSAEETLRQREINLREAAVQSSGAERLARDEYEAGLSDIITVLESQRRSLDASNAHITVREQRLRNRIDLFLALGGGFQSTAELTAMRDSPKGRSVN